MTVSPSQLEVRAAEWVEARQDAEVRRQACNQLRDQRDRALKEARPYESAVAELVELRERIQKAYVDTYLGESHGGASIAELERIVAEKEIHLASLSKRKGISKAAAQRLAAQLAVAERTEAEAVERERSAQEAWAKARMDELRSRFDEAFEALRPLLEDMVAVSKYAPKPKFYSMLNITVGDLPQEIFDQLKRTSEEYPKPSLPFTYKWLRESRVLNLPGVASARERMEVEIAKIMKVQS